MPDDGPVYQDALAPIDEEPSEAGDLASQNAGADDDEQPITMIPRIMHTAPSPTAPDTPLSVLSTPAAAAAAAARSAAGSGAVGGGAARPANGGGEVNQIESVL